MFSIFGLTGIEEALTQVAAIRNIEVDSKG